jgi:hypothetical protein
MGAKAEKMGFACISIFDHKLLKYAFQTNNQFKAFLLVNRIKRGQYENKT